MKKEDVNMQNEKDGRMAGLSKERMKSGKEEGV